MERTRERSVWEHGFGAATILLTPFYWFLMSVAAFRAIWKLYSAPHQWEKTPHFRRGGAIDDPAIADTNISPGVVV